MQGRALSGWRLRPTEWVAITFLVFVGLKAGLAALVAWREVVWGRTVDIAITLMVIEVLVLGREVWRARSNFSVPQRRALAVTLALALVPFIAFVTLAATSTLVSTLDRLAPPKLVLVLLVAGLQLVAWSLPSVVLWLVAARRLAMRQPVTVKAVAVELVTFTLRRLRDWAPFLVLLSGYWWASAAPTRTFDVEVEAIDRVLTLGFDLFSWLDAHPLPTLTAWLVFVYTFYAVLFPLGCGAALWSKGPEGLQRLFFMVGLAFFGAYLSYWLVPVAGPADAKVFASTLMPGLAGPVKEALMDQQRVQFDCFPSMHTCATTLIAVSLWRNARGLFWLLLPITLSMPVACVVLRYHWVTDVVAGLIWAGLVLWFDPCRWFARAAEPLAA